MSDGARTSFLERVGLGRRELRAWAMYDWANSAVMTTVIAAVFPPYFQGVAAAGLPERLAFSRFGVATSIAVIFIGIMSPILGALADFAAVKKRMLGAFMILGAAATAGMFFIQQGDWQIAIGLFMVVNIGIAGSIVFYDALLPHIAKQGELDRASTAGYGLGYLGGGVLLALNLAWILSPGTFGLPSGDDIGPAAATLPVRLALLSAAIWWVLFSIPLFRRVPEPPRRLEADETMTENATRAALARLAETFRHLRGYKYAFLMLLAVLIYGDGITTIIRMATIYGAEIGIAREALIAAILITQLVGAPFAFLFGALAGRIGAKTAILAGLVVYMGITIVGYFMTTATHFLLLAALVGMVQGGTQALSRSLFARLIPRHKSGEFYGFFGVMNRFAGSIGTLAMALITAMTGSPRHGILAIILFFIIGALVLMRVDVAAGERAARQAEVEAGVVT
ncbi:MAG: MFS transporter [Longimicrobiales bacterium]